MKVIKIFFLFARFIKIINKLLDDKEI